MQFWIAIIINVQTALLFLVSFAYMFSVKDVFKYKLLYLSIIGGFCTLTWSFITWKIFNVIWNNGGWFSILQLHMQGESFIGHSAYWKIVDLRNRLVIPNALSWEPTFTIMFVSGFLATLLIGIASAVGEKERWKPFIRFKFTTVLLGLSYIVFFMSMVITTLGQALSLAAR
ncbi:MAG: hypothetical protein HY869_19085 [Chloroflexi bacterium]|nr:hypothetical protein [Chloroflexota bacterium]